MRSVVRERAELRRIVRGKLRVPHLAKATRLQLRAVLERRLDKPLREFADDVRRHIFARMGRHGQGERKIEEHLACVVRWACCW